MFFRSRLFFLVKTITAVLLITFLLRCNIYAVYQDGLRDRIKKAGSFEEIFKLEKSIVLETKNGLPAPKVNYLILSSNGDYIIINNAFDMMKVMVFGTDGKYKNLIGKSGYEAGEYLSPTSLSKDSYGNIYILDQARSRMNVYNPEYKFVKAFSFPASSMFVHINNKNEMYLYQSVKTQRQYNCILKMNTDGKRMAEFAPLPEEIMNVDNYSFCNTMAVDRKSFVYEVNPLWQNIRKYNSYGIFITEFGSKEVTMLPYTDKAGNKSEVPRIVTGLFIFDDILMMVFDDNKMNFYDLDGEEIKKDVEIRKQIVYSSEKGIYLVDEDDSPVRNVLYKYTVQ